MQACKFKLFSPPPNPLYLPESARARVGGALRACFTFRYAYAYLRALLQLTLLTHHDDVFH